MVETNILKHFNQAKKSGQISTTKKNNFQYIVCSKPFERYQIDCAELDYYLTQGIKFYEPLWIIDHFSISDWVYLIKNKQATIEVHEKIITGPRRNFH